MFGKLLVSLISTAGLGKHLDISYIPIPEVDFLG